MPQARTCGYAVGASYFVRLGCWAFALSAGAVGASAQGTGGPQEAAAPVRLVNAAQGREIAAAVLAQDEPIRGRQDCSHLVHQIYSAAGYEYPYATSFDLYAGHGNFRRVRHAQPGDLVAWPGHVGIVTDVARHTFYSLVRSGWQAENYQGPYWRSRGRPRFYRYIVDAGSHLETVKAARSAGPRNDTAHRNSAAMIEGRVEAEKANKKQPMEEASLRAKVLAAPAEPETGPSVTAANAKVIAAPVAATTATESIPSSVLITPAQRRPTPAEAFAAISELGNGAASALRSAEPLTVKTPVVIFDELHVERIETKHDKGWAHLQIDSHVRIASTGPDFKHRREKMRWELRRDASGWMAIAPAGQTYVARDQAVRVLAAQLAEMAQSDAAAQHEESVISQEARIANLLSALLEK